MRGRKPGSPKVTDIAEGRLKSIEGGKPERARQPPPAPPKWLGKRKRARDLWSRLIPQLLARKQYLHLFEVELGRYCLAFDEFVEADAKVKKEGMVVKSPNNYPIQSPYLAIRNRAGETMLRLAADLGLNPVAQHRLDGVQLDLFGDLLPPPAPGGGAPDEETGFGRFRRA